MNISLFLLGIILGSVLILSSVNDSEAILTDANSKDHDIVQSKASYNKQSIDANKKYSKAIISAQTDYDRTKFYAKQVYDNNLLKANGDPQKKSNANYTYNEMVSIAKTNLKKSITDAKKTYHDEINKILSVYSNQNFLK